MACIIDFRKKKIYIYIYIYLPWGFRVMAPRVSQRPHGQNDAIGLKSGFWARLRVVGPRKCPKSRFFKTSRKFRKFPIFWAIYRFWGPSRPGDTLTRSLGKIAKIGQKCVHLAKIGPKSRFFEEISENTEKSENIFLRKADPNQLETFRKNRFFWF